MKLYSYVVRHDTGFAPNPFWGYCTLATCKPEIRRRAQPNDWIIGTGSVTNVGRSRLLYAMHVNKVLTFEEYDRARRFIRKRPNMRGTPRQRCGDNIYYRRADGEFEQRPSRHGPENQARDLGGHKVLIARRFYYWGRLAVDLPLPFRALIKRGPGYKSDFDSAFVTSFIQWLDRHPAGVRGQPSQGDVNTCDCNSRASGRRIPEAARR
jgi:Nucleotide modification associated domain 2